VRRGAEGIDKRRGASARSRPLAKCCLCAHQKCCTMYKTKDETYFLPANASSAVIPLGPSEASAVGAAAAGAGAGAGVAAGVVASKVLACGASLDSHDGVSLSASAIVISLLASVGMYNDRVWRLLSTRSGSILSRPGF
jgi:hypothetical protein